MKDIEGKELQKGDLIIVTPEVNYDEVSFLCVFDSVDDNSEMTYYPLDKDGLDVAKYNNGDFDNGEEGFFRTTPFTMTKAKSKVLRKIDDNLSGTRKYYYDEITQRL